MRQREKQSRGNAEERAIEYFTGLGYTVIRVGDTESYDLKCSKNGETLRVEVKGTQTEGTAIILTANEVESARNSRSALFILHSVKLSGGGKKRKVSGGIANILNPWHIGQDGSLKTISFIYRLSNNGE